MARPGSIRGGPAAVRLLLPRLALLLAALLFAGPRPAAAQTADPDAGSPEYLAMMQAEVAELEARRETLEAEVRKAADALQATRDQIASAESAAAEAEDRAQALADDTRAAEKRLRDLEALAADGDQRRAVVASLDADATRAREALARLQSEVADAEAQRDSLDGDIAQRRTVLAGLESNARAAAQRERETLARIAAAQEQLQALETQAGQNRTEAAALDAITAEVAAARTAGADADTRLKALNASIAERQADLARLDSELASRTEAAAAAPVAPPPPPLAAPVAGSRSQAAVLAAVGAAPGLGSATPDQRAALISALESGTCVTDALSATLGAINRQTAAALVRGLGGC